MISSAVATAKAGEKLRVPGKSSDVLCVMELAQRIIALTAFNDIRLTGEYSTRKPVSLGTLFGSTRRWYYLKAVDKDENPFTIRLLPQTEKDADGYDLRTGKKTPGSYYCYLGRRVVPGPGFPPVPVQRSSFWLLNVDGRTVLSR